MTKGILGVIACPMLEDELIYSMSHDPEDKNVLVLETPYNGSLRRKLDSNGVPYTTMDEWEFMHSESGLDRNEFNIVIKMKNLALHAEPKVLMEDLENDLTMIQGRVDAVAMYYGMCGNYGWDLTEWGKEHVDFPIEVFRVEGLWEEKSNMAEAQKIVQLLREFFTNRKDDETVGIITFNASQRDLINDVLDEECANDPGFGKLVADEMKRFDNGEDVGLFIKNIESVQGDERDVIMFSIGYAKNSEGKLMQRFGWLNNRGGENRLNVAISRAKKKIIIVSSFEPEDLQVDGTKNEGPRILKKYLQYANAISSGNREYADSILHSFSDDRWDAPEDFDSGRIADRVYNALTRKGYTVERNVGIGGYQIDLAVKQNDRYILGIECDSRLYEMSSSTRERDYHRQKYLESRGWKIHRVWTPGMWKDPEKEIARIIQAIERNH